MSLLYLVRKSEATTVIDGISHPLIPGGRCVIYGPIMQESFLANIVGDVFYQRLIKADPDIGYKD